MAKKKTAKKKTAQANSKPPETKKKKVIKTLEPIKHNGTVYGVGETITDTKGLNIDHLVKHKVIEIVEE